jgi:hypothetical protein
MSGTNDTARALAARIISQPTREARANMLFQAPPELAKIAKTMVEIHFQRVNHERRQKAKDRAAE